MIPFALGDRAQLFTGMRHNGDIRSRLATLTEEMSTGRPADMVAHLKGDTAPLAELDRRLALADSFGAAAQQVGQRLSVMQVALENIEATRARALDQIVVPSQTGERAIAALAARAAFDDIAAALNTRWGEDSLFAGTDTGGPALAPAQTMMAGIRAAVTGAVSAADVFARLDDWFGDPASGFATTAYLGSATSMSRSIDADATVAIEARADDPAMRGLLRAAALGVLAADASLGLPDSEANALLQGCRDGFLSAAAPLTMMRAGLGQAEALVEEAVARHAGRETAWGILRNEMSGADPFATASAIEALRTRLETHYEITSRLSSLNLASFLR